MAIPSKRFSVLDNETNVSTANFGLGADSSIMNSPINELKPKLTKLASLISSSFSTDGLSLPEEKTDLIGAATRLTKDGLGNIIDFSSIPTESLTEMFGSITDSIPLIKNVLSVITKCMGGSGGYGYGMGRGMNRGGGCGSGYGSGKSGCSIPGFGDLLSKITNGNFNSGQKDYDSQIRALMAMSGMGYDMGYCNVFGSLSGNLDKRVLTRAAGGLLGYLGKSGNTTGFMDVVKSSTGLSPLSINPTAITTFFDNFKIPAITKQKNYPFLADAVMESSESLKSDWNRVYGNNGSVSNGVSLTDGPSLGFITNYQSGLDTIFTSKLTTREFDSDTLDVVPDADDDFFMAAYAMSV